MNKKMYLVLLTILIINSLTCCKAQNDNNPNMETYNFELMNRSQYPTLGIVRNGWKIVVSKMSNTGAFYNEYPPAPRFDKVVKLFHPNGNLKYTGKLVGEYLSIGESVYYDEEGKIIKRINEDANFGKFKLDDLLRFIEKEGWINLETGEGREDVEIVENGRFNKTNSHFSIYEIPNSDGTKFWQINIRAMPYNNFIKTTYHLDKDTGEVLYKNSEKINYKR